MNASQLVATMRVRGSLWARIVIWYVRVMAPLLPVKVIERRLRWALARVRVEMKKLDSDTWITVADGEEVAFG